MVSLFDTTRFNFFLNFDRNCVFYEFILFPCQIITLLTKTIEGMHNNESSKRCKKAYLDMLIDFVELLMLFGLRQSYLLQLSPKI